MGCTQPVGTDSFGGMSCLKFDKGLVDQSTNLSDITEKFQSNISVYCLGADGMWCNNTASTLKGQTWYSWCLSLEKLH